MKTTEFKNIVRNHCKERAFHYLMDKRKTKGSEIKYNGIETADYLMPNNILNIEEKRKIFSIRNKMLKIPSYFVSRDKNTYICICNQKESMEHIYNCEYLNTKTPEIKFEEIFRENISKQKKVLQRLEENLNAKIMKENHFSHVIPSGDPSFSMTVENGNGL